MTNREKKIRYCSIAFVATIFVALLLALLLPFSFVRYTKSGQDFFSASGLRVLLGLFGEIKSSGDVAISGQSVFYMLASVFMLLFLLSGIYLLVITLLKLIKKQNIIHAPLFKVWMLVFLFVGLFTFALGIVVAYTNAGQNSLVVTSWMWIPLVLTVATAVLAHEFLQKFEYEDDTQENQENIENQESIEEKPCCQK